MDRLPTLFVLGLLSLLPSIAKADIIFFDLQGKAGSGLLAGNENFTVNGTPGSGGEVGTGISFDNVFNVLTINVGWGSGNGFTDLTGIVVGAHLHGPTASSGVTSFNENAGIQFSLDGATSGFNSSGTNGGWTNTTVNLSPALAANLLAGRMYLNVHTLANSQGEIRGNLVLASVPEPGSLSLVALGLLAYAVNRRRRSARNSS